MMDQNGPRLDLLREGQRARIVDIDGDDAVAIRLMEMGLTDGEDIECVGFAPMGDPIEYLVRGYRVSLRRAEARRVRIECGNDECRSPNECRMNVEARSPNG